MLNLCCGKIRKVSEEYIPFALRFLCINRKSSDARSDCQCGGEALQTVAFEMERAAKDGDLNAVGAYMPRREAEFDCLKQAMKEELLT
jgi:hypothetical protein